jgi:NTE family protein
MTNDTLRPGIALGLSGGGFRATLFHIGTLIRLNELGYLAKLDRISAVSGGSITAGMLACSWETLKTGGFTAADLERLVTLPLRKFCARNIDARVIAEGTISPWSSISDVLTREYDELFGHTRLPALPDSPRTIFNTTNLQTGRDFRISKKYMADYRVGQITIPISAWARPSLPRAHFRQCSHPALSRSIPRAGRTSTAPTCSTIRATSIP